MRKSVKRFAIFAGVLAFVGASAKNAAAGWLTWIGVLLTIIAIPASVLPPVAGTLAVGEVVLIVTDVVITTNSMSSASSVGGAEENPRLAMLNTMAGEIYLHPLPHLPEFGEDSTELIAATNHLIDCANSFNQHNAAHERQEILSLDLLAIANALNSIADELDDLGVGSTEFSGQQLSDIQDDLMSDGLPQSEVDYLQDAGFSGTFITNFHSLHGGRGLYFRYHDDSKYCNEARSFRNTYSC